MKWIGAFSIEKFLETSLKTNSIKPPEEKGVYIISKKGWEKKPTPRCEPLYIGGTTGRSQRFRTRIGALLADMFGLFGGGTGHHSGGQKLHSYCLKNNMSPLKLFIGWAELARHECKRCAEIDIYNEYRSYLLNKNRPSRCMKNHKNMHTGTNSNIGNKLRRERNRQHGRKSSRGAP